MSKTITYLFSAKAAAQGGTHWAEVPDGDGGRKAIEYTAADDPEKYKWDDKAVVWSGSRSDARWLRDGRSPETCEPA